MPRYDLECKRCRGVTIVYLRPEFADFDVQKVDCDFCNAEEEMRITGFDRDVSSEIQDLHAQIRRLPKKEIPGNNGEDLN